NKPLFIITIFMYILSVTFWAYSIADVIDWMHVYLNNPVAPNLTPITKWYNLFNAVVLVNIRFDGVVVWRAWIICSRDYQKYLYIPLVLLMLTARVYTSLIVTV
ncbi:hypothetical protein B0H10DRAFT_1761121, partial [Mycena sp. CBHHK59/15]